MYRWAHAPASRCPWQGPFKIHQRGVDDGDDDDDGEDDDDDDDDDDGDGDDGDGDDGDDDGGAVVY